jgi:hypothetical protein
MPSTGAYSFEDLAMLARVLDDARKAVVELRGSKHSDEDLKELSGHLGQVIMKRFTAGETDPEILKKIAVESVQHRP